MKILEQLWHNGLCPSESLPPTDSSYHKHLDEVLKNDEKLRSMLSDEAKEVFEKFDESKEEMAAIDRSKIFAAGFRPGAKIILEVMEQEDKK